MYWFLRIAENKNIHSFWTIDTNFSSYINTIKNTRERRALSYIIYFRYMQCKVNILFVTTENCMISIKISLVIFNSDLIATMMMQNLMNLRVVSNAIYIS